MNLNIASSPHIRGRLRTNRLMGDVCIALMPALAMGIWKFGVRALLVTIVTVLTAVAAEGLYCMITKKRNTITDGSAVVTGLLLAMTLPHTVPYLQAAAGSMFAVIIVKAMCQGLGQNIFNPALAARACMLLFWPVSMVRYVPRVNGIDGISEATPLHQMAMPQLPKETLLDLFLGNTSGSIGEISTLALLLGATYLIFRKVISIRIPAAYLGTMAVLTLFFPRTDTPILWMLYSLCSGGVVLGAFFMATDYATSPSTPKGQILYGIGCGALNVYFRYYGVFPEGVTYAILFMNACVWWLDRYTSPRRFGYQKGGRIN